MNNGGKAFPNDMTLRDYFATHALQGLLANPQENKIPGAWRKSDLSFYSRLAYLLAERMLFVRDEPNPTVKFEQKDQSAEINEPAIDWSQAPEWANWWAMDMNKEANWYDTKPSIMEGIANAPSFNYTGPWETSLRERPK